MSVLRQMYPRVPTVILSLIHHSPAMTRRVNSTVLPRNILGASNVVFSQRNRENYSLKRLAQHGYKRCYLLDKGHQNEFCNFLKVLKAKKNLGYQNQVTTEVPSIARVLPFFTYAVPYLDSKRVSAAVLPTMSLQYHD